MHYLKRLFWNSLFLLPSWVVRWIFGRPWLKRRLFPDGFGLGGLEGEVISISQNCSSKVYIELGANDGIRQSNTKALEDLGWSGILIEPVPKLYKRLKKSRSKNNFFTNTACVPFEHASGKVQIMDLDLMSSSPSLVHSEFDSEKQELSALKHMVSSNQPKLISVPAKPLSEIISSSGLGNEIGILSLDVEGAELSVLRGIDFEKHFFEYLLIETAIEHEVSDFLASKGYKLQKKLSNHDFLYTEA